MCDGDQDAARIQDPQPPGETTPLRLALARLVRGERGDLASLLQSVVVECDDFDDLHAEFHCHFVSLDGNGRPMVPALAEELCAYILDYAIPRSRIVAAGEGDTVARDMARLYREAVKLFTDLERTGEGGELLLFALTETVLQLPQILCKMSVKTNERMHYHGSDGIHAEVDAETGHLCLYWGESKLKKTFAAAINDCIASLAPYLLEDYGTDPRGLEPLT